MKDSGPGNRSFFRLTGRVAVFAAGLALLCACGELRPVPPVFKPQAYTPIKYQALLNPKAAGLHDDQLVRVKAYFWEFLTYDPAMGPNYLTILRHPVGWLHLRWFALYGTEEMKGYYDLAALDESSLHLYKLKRLDPIMVYGQLCRLSPCYYLHVHRIEKVQEN